MWEADGRGICPGAPMSESLVPETEASKVDMLSIDSKSPSPNFDLRLA